jgi:peptide/nickel transport system ATP-binding protein
MTVGLPVLRVEHLTTRFPTTEGVVTAVDSVSFSVAPGETFAIVGESGSGKSVTAFSILGLVEPPGFIAAGAVWFKGRNLRDLGERDLRMVRGGAIAIIFQDPITALHPLLRIEEQMVDAVLAHRKVRRAQARREAVEALAAVNIAAPEDRLSAYPHQLSGGMRQRVAIAIAMINKPDVIIADEPTTALDVTTQAQILQEMKRLCAARGTALIWITHDLAVVAEIADRVAVMYAGSIVELGAADAVLSRPAHPYTAGLLGSIPANNRGRPRLRQIPGSVQSASSAPGCRFAPRCDRRLAACDAIPDLVGVAAGQMARCVNPLQVTAPTLATEVI